MTASGGDGGVKYCVRACMCAFYLLVVSAEWHAGATLGRVGLCCGSTLSLSLPGQMAPVTETGGGAVGRKVQGWEA